MGNEGGGDAAKSEGGEQALLGSPKTQIGSPKTPGDLKPRDLPEMSLDSRLSAGMWLPSWHILVFGGLLLGAAYKRFLAGGPTDVLVYTCLSCRGRLFLIAGFVCCLISI